MSIYGNSCQKRPKFYYYPTNIGIFVGQNRDKHFDHLSKTHQAEDEVEST